MSKQKQKGTWFETKVAQYLKDNLGVPIERRTLGGVNDKGDIAGVHVGDTEVIIECKNHGTYALKEWLAEAKREAENAGGLGVVVFHGHGVGETRMGEQYVLMNLETFTEIIKRK